MLFKPKFILKSNKLQSMKCLSVIFIVFFFRHHCDFFGENPVTELWQTLRIFSSVDLNWWVPRSCPCLRRLQHIPEHTWILGNCLVALLNFWWFPCPFTFCQGKIYFLLPVFSKQWKASGSISAWFSSA